MSQIDSRKVHKLKFPAIREFRKQKKDPSKELHQVLDETELLQINELFNQEEGKRMNKGRLKEVLAKVAKIDYPEDVFERTFLKINSAWQVFTVTLKLA